MPEFLSAQEIAQKLHEFKESWYSFVKRSEALAEHSSALGGGVEKSLEAMLREVQACEDALAILNPSLKHALPNALNEIEQISQSASRAVSEIKGELILNLEDVRALGALSAQLAELEKKLNEIESEERALAEQESKACAKYETRKRYYDQAYEALTKAVEKRIAAMKRRFVDKASAISQGYEVMLHGKSYAAEELFEKLLQKPSAAEDVTLAQKSSFLGFGKKGEEAKIKTTVLAAVAKEILAEAAPLKSEELRELAKLDAEFADLKGLESACASARKRREEIRSEGDAARAKAQEIKQGRAYSYASYDGILRLREGCLKHVEASSEAVKSLLSFAERSFSAAELEPDPEKRELKAELSKLKQHCEALEREKDAEKRLREKAEQQVENLINEKLELQKKLEAMDAQARQLRVRVQILEEERRNSRNKLNELKRQIGGMM